MSPSPYDASISVFNRIVSPLWPSFEYDGTSGACRVEMNWDDAMSRVKYEYEKTMPSSPLLCSPRRPPTRGRVTFKDDMPISCES